MGYNWPHRLAWVAEDTETGTTRLTLMHLPNGKPMILEGSSALIWLLACEVENVPDVLSAIVGQPACDIAADTEAFVADLVRRGLLVPDTAR